MPTYRFECENDACRRPKVSVIRSVTDEPVTEKFCSECGQKMTYLGSDKNEQISGSPVNRTKIISGKSETEESIIFMENEEIFAFVEDKPTLNGMKLAVEETKQYVDSGIIVVYNEIGEKLYFKEGKKLKEGVELIPLSKEELKGLDIEETANDSLFEIKIEEVI